MVAHRSAVLLALVLTVACGAPAAAPVTPSPTATAPAGRGEPGVARFEVDARSKAIVRVREQLAGLPAPSDAVLETSEVTGRFGLRADGTFTPDSRITVGLAALRSDSSRRDGFIKGDTLQVSRFPTADFVPVRARSVPLPLPATGEWTLTVDGKMTIRGVEKDVTFAVRAKRDAQTLTASAANEPTWKFGDFGIPIPRVAVVLSITDEIRLEVELVANEVR